MFPMTWENVLPLLSVIGGFLVGFAGLVWIMARLFGLLVRNEVREGMEELYRRMKDDFKHLERQIADGLVHTSGLLEGLKRQIADVRRGLIRGAGSLSVR